MFWFQKLIKAIKDERAQNNGYESETKDVLKPICNDDCVVLGRSKAKNQNNAIVLTVMLQSFGTRLRGRRFNPFNGINRRPPLITQLVLSQPHIHYFIHSLINN